MNESHIQEFWDRHKINIHSNRRYPKVTIYDGPPFPNGPPHHGHMMTSTVKDTIVRYLTATEHYVPRVIGWDMHSPSGINEVAAMEYIDSWTKTIKKLGRWIDPNHYFTSDPEYVRSVNWVFQSLCTKGHIREQVGLTPYCKRCQKYFSDFERYQHSCKVTECSVYYKVPVRSRVKGDKQCIKFISVWEMWPWTLNSVTAYALAKSGLTLKDGILSNDPSGTPFGLGLGLDLDLDLEALDPISNTYVPIYFSDKVDPLMGTGIVRIAPTLDYRSMTMCTDVANEIINDTPPQLVDNDTIIQKLKTGGYLIKVKHIERTDSACPVCHERLITYPCRGYYYKITENRAAIGHILQQIYWEPRSSKERIMWYLSQANDWLITRITDQDQDQDRAHVVGHPNMYYDNWFESACMPYGSTGYPYKTTKMELLESLFPCKLAIEGTDQIYGWFFTTNVISYSLFNVPAFQTIITNGLVLDGNDIKLSKSQSQSQSQSQTSASASTPDHEIQQHGADAYRIYLMKNRLLSGINFRYQTEDVGHSLFTRNLINAFNRVKAYTSPVGHMNINFRPSKITNITDNWILQSLDDYLTNYHSLMKLYKVARALALSQSYLSCIKKYIHYNRDRTPNVVLLRVFYYYILTVAPFVPYTSEYIYQELKQWISGPISVHMCQIPTKQWTVNKQFLESANLMFNVIDLVKPMPKTELTVYVYDLKLVNGIRAYIKDITGHNITYRDDLSTVLSASVKIQHRQAFGDTDIHKLEAMSLIDIIRLEQDGYYMLSNNNKVYPGQYSIVYAPLIPNCQYGHGICVRGSVSPSVSRDDTEIITKGQLIGRKLDRLLKRYGHCIISMHRPTEIKDARAEVLIANINRYTLPIIGQTIHTDQSTSTSSKEELHKTEIVVWGSSLEFVFHSSTTGSKIEH